MSRRDTVALKWLLGATLRNHRKAARKTLGHAAAHLGVSESKISNMESGRYGQSPEEIAALLALYGAEPGRSARIVALAQQEETGSWWAPWSGVLPDWLRLFAGLEGMAASAFVYSPLFVHALLQTEEYATAVAASARRVRPVDMDRMVAFRMERQRRLVEGASPLELHFVIEETALLRPIGGEEVLRRQAEHLVKAARLPGVDIQVIEAGVGMHPGLTGEFTLFGFEEFDDAVYVELQEDAVYLNDSAKVRAYSMTAKTLRDIALDRHESASLIASLVRAR
ncbi:helix-turn-helix transcriptional regulator [Actinosynnema sp. NPDC023658]|uniref:helix-turn-helix domain-containing protein n=1 Tax=Actinosynnema sp. NPDC023658 TaxID=3155465 RepID=UPI0033EF2741